MIETDSPNLNILVLTEALRFVMAHSRHQIGKEACRINRFWIDMVRNMDLKLLRTETF